MVLVLNNIAEFLLRLADRALNLYLALYIRQLRGVSGTGIECVHTLQRVASMHHSRLLL